MVQDAMRRDLTINALFYNLDTGGVEDFTGRGLDDLRAGIIRTPLEPRVTFLDGAAFPPLPSFSPLGPLFPGEDEFPQCSPSANSF